MAGSFTTSYTIEVLDKFSQELAKFSKAMEKVEKKAADVGEKIEKGLDLDKMSKNITSFGKKMTKFVTLPIVGLMGASLKFSAELEDVHTSLTIFTGSAEIASKTLSKLEDISAKSIFNLKEYSEAGRLLLVAGYNADQMVAKTSQLADMASVFNIPLETMATLFSFSKQNNVFSSKEMANLMRQGVPVLKELGIYIEKVTGKKYSADQIKKFVSEGRVSFKAFEGIVTQMTSKGGVAFKGMEKKTDTLSGAFIKLKNDSEKVLSTIGTEINRSLGATKKINLFSEGLLKFNDGFVKFAAQNPNTVKNIAILVTALATVGPVITGIGWAIKALTVAMMANPLIVAATLIVTAIGLLYANKDKIASLVDSKMPASNQLADERNKMGLSHTNFFSKRLEKGRSDSLASQQKTMNESSATVNINLSDPGKMVKSAAVKNLGLSGLNFGTNNNISPLPTYSGY